MKKNINLSRTALSHCSSSLDVSRISTSTTRDDRSISNVTFKKDYTVLEAYNVNLKNKRSSLVLGSI